LLGGRKVFWLGAPIDTVFPACASDVVVRMQLPIQRRDRAGISPASLRRPPLSYVRRRVPGRLAAPTRAARLRRYPATVRGHSITPWLPAIAWAALIFAFSSIPSLGTGLGFWDLLLRKLAHAAEFGILALLIWRAWRWETAAAVLATAYAATDEYHQTFVSGRVGSVRDWAIDTAGVVVALVCLYLWRMRRARRAVPAAPRLDELSENAP
jgi:VanZ family protein